MTVALGIVCTDGVLVASDSMGSSGPVATHVDKVRALEHNGVIWVFSGPQYVGQQVETAIAQSDDDRQSPCSPASLSASLCDVIKEAYDVPVVPPGGNHEDLKNYRSEALLLGWQGGQPAFFHVPSDLAPVECREGHFLAIGSGHEYASVVAAALAHHTGKPLTLDKAMLVAFRIVTTVCKVSSWGVGLPVQMAIADESGARVLLRDELERIETGYQRWLTSERTDFAGGEDAGSGQSDLPSIQPAASSESA